jgi:hypothetical protein
MTNELLSEQQGLINFAIKFHNAKVMEAYGHKKDEESQRILSLMLLTDKDSLIVSLYKMNNFYNVADRSTREYIDYPGQSIVKRSRAVILGEVRLSSAKKYVNGKPIGTYRIKIPHFKEELFASVRDYHQEFGNTRMIYAFEDKKQLKVNVISETEGYRVLNHLLKAVDPKKKLGTAEEHAYKGNMPPDAEPHKLTGLTLTAKAVRVLYPDKTSLVYQL